jgi:FlaG/FlaF family flagellin (archaellin)
VILGAVVGTAALGFGDQVEENVQAGATVEFDQQDNSFTVTWVSEGNADYLNVSLSGDLEYDEDGGASDGPVTLRSAGSTATFDPPGSSEKVEGSAKHYDSTGGLNDPSTEHVLADTISDGDEIRVTVVAALENGETETTVLTKEGEY